MSVGVVVIGRNEGERLRRCLASVIEHVEHVVYVDSGSTDASLPMARAMGIEAIELDMTIPFCAARARNAGYERLIQCHPQLRFVQFIDGDCELIDGWLSAAVTVLESQPEQAIVVGWLHERSPEVSIYNRLGDLEWNFAGVGEVDAVGGIFMIRCEAFERVGGFDPTVASGEEPELCQRLSRQGWRFLRLDRNMALHDLAMTRFSQWWKRQVRFGYGGMSVAERFRLPRFRRNNLRVRLWTGWLIAVLIACFLTAAGQFSDFGLLPVLLLFSLWPAQLCRIALRTWRKGHPFDLSAAYAFFLMVSYWPQMAGQLLYWNDRSHKRAFRLIEHKSAGVSASGHGR